MRETIEARRKRTQSIIAALEKAYPDARCALDFTTPLELLVATILAAQCTDERVNIVTASLFKKYRTAADYAAASPPTFEREIQSTGFFRAKTRSVLGMARALVESHRGEVPRTREDLVALPGVGLKTASVVLGNAFGQPAIAVDTHVFRVTQRLGLGRADDPDKLHDQLAEVVPRAKWTRFCHLIQAHGRRTCTARTPACPVCPVRQACPWPDKTRPAQEPPGARARATHPSQRPIFGHPSGRAKPGSPRVQRRAKPGSPRVQRRAKPGGPRVQRRPRPGGPELT
jgi:endonuclease-3